MSSNKLLIHDVLIVSAVADETPFIGWVKVEGHRISAVGHGPALEKGSLGERVIDGLGCALLPGFINTHAHSHSSLTRGSAEGLELEDWIATIEKEQSRLSDEDAYVAAIATYGEALLSGTTSILDMCLRPEPAMRAAQAIGMRAVIAPYVLDDRNFAPSIARMADLLKHYGAEFCQPGGRTQLWVGIHDLESCSDKTISLGAELAAVFSTGLHLHCSESQFSVTRTRERTGRTPIVHLQTLGALGPRTILAHCVWADEHDQALLAGSGTSVAHCPHANLKLASGIAPIAAMRKAGVRVALATDGAKANNRLDMFDVMKFASLVPRGITLDPLIVPPEAIFAMATREGAAALNLEAGRIAPGLLADLNLVDLRQFHLQPGTPGAVVTNLVHAARGPDVRMVIVDGEVVVADGRLTKVDQSVALSAMREVGSRLLADS